MRRTDVAGWARAAGVTGVAANVLLVAFYAVDLGRPALLLGVSLGTLDDVLVAVSSALMLPVVAAGPRRPRPLGLAAAAVLAVASVLLVTGVLTFDVQLPVMIGGIAGLAVWLAVSAEWFADVAGAPVGRLGRSVGRVLPVAMVLVGAGLALPWLSWPQLVLFAVGGIPGALAWLALPVWFLVLADGLRHAARRPEPVTAPER